MNMLTPHIDVVDMQAKVRIAGKVIARNMSYDTFMDTDFGDKHVEWVNELVIEMAGPVPSEFNFLNMKQPEVIFSRTGVSDDHWGSISPEDLVMDHLRRFYQG